MVKKLSYLVNTSSIQTTDKIVLMSSFYSSDVQFSYSELIQSHMQQIIIGLRSGLQSANISYSIHFEIIMQGRICLQTSKGVRGAQLILKWFANRLEALQLFSYACLFLSRNLQYCTLIIWALL